MLPDFVKVKQQLREKIIFLMKAQTAEHPILRKVGRTIHYEGHATSFMGEDGHLAENQYTQNTSPIEIPIEEIIKGGPEKFLEHGISAAFDMQRQLLDGMVKTLNEGTAQVGNVVDAKGKPFSAELYLEALEKMMIAFNKDGTPVVPSFMGPPAMQERIKTEYKRLEDEPELKKKLTDILLKKKEEWDAEEGNRKLVD